MSFTVYFKFIKNRVCIVKTCCKTRPGVLCVNNSDGQAGVIHVVVVILCKQFI